MQMWIYMRKIGALPAFGFPMAHVITLLVKITSQIVDHSAFSALTCTTLCRFSRRIFGESGSIVLEIPAKLRQKILIISEWSHAISNELLVQGHRIAIARRTTMVDAKCAGAGAG